MYLTPEKSNETWKLLLTEVEAALKARGISGRSASLNVVGNDGLIRDIKAGTLPSFDRVKALCEYLGIDFHIGPRRDTGPVSVTMIDGEEFAAIPRLDVRLSAGGGAANDDPALVETLAFRREWLNRLGVNPSDAVIVSVRGDSMEPGLHDGDLALIDQARKALRTGRIYALTDIDGATRVKRVEILQGQGYLLRSDNPAYPVEARLNDDSNRMKIIGQVVWSGHTHKA